LCDATMSDSPDDTAPLFIAVQLVRLRDRMKGSTRLDYSEWLESMVGLEVDLRQLAGNQANGRRKPGTRRRADLIESVQWRLAFFERDFALWRGIFADETTTIAKFLNLLATLQLNVSSELEELKSLSQRNDYALHNIEGFKKQLRLISSGEKTVGFEVNYSVYRELLGIAVSLEKLKGRVDEKVEDAVRLISLMTATVDPQTLIDLLTGEV